MKKVIIAIVCCMVSVMSYGQLRWGIEAGANISHALETNKTKAGFNIGARADYSLSSLLYLDATLKLSSQPCGYDNTNYYVDKPESGSRVVANFTPYYLTLPVRIGLNFKLNKYLKTYVAAGPMIGVGLFGKGDTKHYANVSSSGEGTLTGSAKLDNVFKNTFDGCFSTSRFEYGANINLGLEFMSHYRLGFEYSIIHIPGDVNAVDNMNIYSISLGYVF